MNVVLFGNATEINAAIRYRVVKFATMLAAEGHTCTLCLPSSLRQWERLYQGRSRGTKLLYVLMVLLRRIVQLRHVVGADAVCFRGPVFSYGPTVFEHVIRALNPRLVFDIDDAVWERPAYVTSPFVRFQDFRWVWKMCRLCAHAIVGNAYLKEHIEKRNPNVTIIPTCVDMDVHTPKTYTPCEEERPVILGWTGLSSNLGYMEVIEQPLRALAREHRIVVHVASNGAYHLDGVDVLNRGWELAHEVDYLQTPDIGLMPLTRSRRALGKCSFKALEFMAVGTPCVISPVGMNAEIVQDGVTGFLADSPQEWHEKLTRLVVDPALRERMGRAARRFVIENYAHEVHYPRFRAVLETVAATKR